MSTPALARLRLRDFRNFSRLDWRPPAPRLLLSGPNGAGKSSLLEAIYLAATTRSFRTARLEPCLRRGAESFSIRLEVGERPRRELAIDWSPGERHRRLDGRTATLAEHLAVLPVLAWSQADNELLSGGAEVRRRFFDRGMVQQRPATMMILGRYQKALAAKRALLAGPPTGELDAWNELLAREGAALAAARAAAAGELAAGLAEMVARHAPELPAPGVRYRPGSPSALAGESALRAELAAARPLERSRARALVGPHRDDFELLWKGEPARLAASAGERKALGLLLLAAQAGAAAGAGREPLLLLDDADAELDRERLRRVIGAFAGVARLVVTSSRPAAWEGIEGLTEVPIERLAGGSGEPT